MTYQFFRKMESNSLAPDGNV